jgi:hypothetical protein
MNNEPPLKPSIGDLPIAGNTPRLHRIVVVERDLATFINQLFQHWLNIPVSSMARLMIMDASQVTGAHSDQGADCLQGAFRMEWPGIGQTEVCRV